MPYLSIIIPLYNEIDNLSVLHRRCLETLEDLERKIGRDFEIIFVNDGSSDGTEEALAALAAGDSRIVVANLARNSGQTAAMQAGFDLAQGEIIVPMDGDLQNDPADIESLLDKLAEGYDVVSGWRKNRLDHALRRNLPSLAANKIISLVSGVHLNDYGCSLKAYRRNIVRGVRIYGEMHRFIPIYASWEGARVTEIPVRHHQRLHGKSKYGLERTLKVILDLLVVKYLDKYLVKPIYVFGGFGLAAVFVSLVSFLIALFLKIFKGLSFVSTPLLLFCGISFLIGFIALLMGLLAEVLFRTYFEAQGRKSYRLKSLINASVSGSGQ